MTADEFQLVRELVRKRSGILLDEELVFVAERKLRPRLEALGLTNFGTYPALLEKDAAELDAAIDALITHETYFFREPHQLEAFSRELLPLLQRTAGADKHLRLWSAGCSTGEEAYTAAMLVEESGLFDGWEVEVHGTDFSERLLQRARPAEYSAHALRETSSERIQRHFDRLGGRFRVIQPLRRQVHFSTLNLVEPGQATRLPQMDAIFCRNVFIYLDPSARQRVLEVLYGRLRPLGYLLLGHAESLVTKQSGFQPVPLRTDLVYQKPC